MMTLFEFFFRFHTKLPIMTLLPSGAEKVTSYGKGPDTKKISMVQPNDCIATGHVTVGIQGRIQDSP